MDQDKRDIFLNMVLRKGCTVYTSSTHADAGLNWKLASTGATATAVADAILSNEEVATKKTNIHALLDLCYHFLLILFLPQ